MVTCQGSTRNWKYLDDYWSCAGGLSPVNAISTQLRDPINTDVTRWRMAVCFVLPFFLEVRLVDVPAGVTQEDGRTGLLHLPSAVLALIFLARRIQPFLSLVDREVEFVYPRSNHSPLVGHHVRKKSSSCDCAKIRTHVPTSEGFEVTK